MLDKLRQSNIKKLNSTVMDNVKHLYDLQWSQRETQGKSVYNVTITGNANLKTLSLVAQRAKIPLWYLFIKMPPHLLESNDLSELVANFVNTSPETQRAVLHLLKAQPTK